ncbi:putative ribosomal protein S11 [Cardiosporidium cionae]|uniref:Ribosomal protein S11 n=1 Tax=Cardiosporidium cionae TaxID=476202 RepID=A0ABQ7J632_9APIC|nr:putative ribosomal protein S11 [Cardiosporidium cionae]|eukprot:KAF8819145.1 putative ribosomal protein S11 [Cardiosporidium cionae]
MLGRGGCAFAMQDRFLRMPIHFSSISFVPLLGPLAQSVRFSGCVFDLQRCFATSQGSYMKSKPTAAGLSPPAQKALATVTSQLRSTKVSSNSSLSEIPRPRRTLSKKELKTLEGSSRRYQLMGDRPEFHNIDRNKNDHIVEPTDKFQVVLTTSKNNVHIQVNNRSRDYRTIFSSCAGNVGIFKAAQQTTHAAERIALNIARKCKRFGISHVDVKFRRIMRIDTCLQAFMQAGLTVTSLTHEPLLPKCGQNSAKPRKRRRV